MRRRGRSLSSKEASGKVLSRSSKPILEPARDWGMRFGCTNHVVAESLLGHENRWWLVVCLAFA
jgi:predicted GH43/DUF377 family glycosyl hydrolase